MRIPIVLFISLSTVFHGAICLLPPKFQWKTIDFAWEQYLHTRQDAMISQSYIPQNIIPSGIARWKDKLFITIPRWKEGVTASLNYVYLNGSQDQPLRPYPTWGDSACLVTPGAASNCTDASIISAFRPFVDDQDRLWLVDNGLVDMLGNKQRVVAPAIVVFDLKLDSVIFRFPLDDVTTTTSVFTSIIVDTSDKNQKDTMAYITDIGSNAIVLFSLKDRLAWRMESPFFRFDPSAGQSGVGVYQHSWNDGVSAIALGPVKKKNLRELYFSPTSSTKQYKISTKALLEQMATVNCDTNAVEVVGDRGPDSQVSACALDLNQNVLFYTQISKNGIGCWNLDKPFNAENAHIVVSDCTVLDFPSDVQVDSEGNLWILSNRQSRFLSENMNFKDVNFRVLSAPAADIIQGTPCDKKYKKK